MYFRLLSDENQADKDKLYCLAVPQHRTCIAYNPPLKTRCDTGIINRNSLEFGIFPCFSQIFLLKLHLGETFQGKVEE
jgi:hypothetical protein